MNTIKINITKDPNYGFSNLEFSEKPTTEMLQELKNNGWRYSSHFKRWYPATEEAKKNAESFAQDYYRHYTSEEQTKTIKTAESLVDLNSIENSVDAYISEYENEMKKGNYNAFVEVQEFIKKNSFITPKAKSYINRFIHSINDIKGVTAFVAYGKDFYTYDEGIKLISELNSKIEKYKSIKNNPAQNEYSDLLNMIKDELKMIDNSRNKGTLYSVLQKEGDSYEQKIRRSNERNNGDGRTDYSGESGNSLGNKVEEQRSVHNSDKISDPAGHSDSKMHDGLDSGRSTELEANGTSADIQRQRLQSNALEQEKLSETDKVNDSTRDAGNGTQNLSEGRVEVYSSERKGSIGAVGNGLNKYGEIQRKIYSYESFGYEGALVTVETDLRRGIPAIDIVGLADSAVKESRERVRAAFKNSGLEFPAERVLMSLSPADLKKDSAAHDLAIALSVLNEKYGYKGEPVLALGELELSGKLRPVRSVYAAVENAIKEGIRNIIVPKQNVEEVLAIPGVNVLGVSSLEEAHEKLINNEPFVTKETFVEPAKELGINLQTTGSTSVTPSINFQKQVENLGKALYTINKEAKVYRELKSDLYYYLRYNDSTDNLADFLSKLYKKDFINKNGKLGIYTSADEFVNTDNVDKYIHDTEKEIEELEYTKDNADEEDIEDIESDIESDIEYYKDFVSEYKDIKDLLYSVEHDTMQQLKEEESSLYKLKNLVLETLKPEVIEYHRFENGEIRPLYKIDDYTFHGAEIEESDNLDIAKELKTISADNKLADKITVEEAKEILNSFINSTLSNINLQKVYHGSGADFDKFNTEQLTSKKDIKAIREQCREILKKPDNEITDEDKLILAQYEGAGGLNEENRTISGILNEFYTPNNLVEKVWQVVDTYAPEAKTVLEPSAGVGKFANNRPNNTFTMHELDETSARINKILHPEANVIQGAYQKQFFDAGERIHIPQQEVKYDVVIGNPPYGAYNDKYKGLGEGKEFDRYEEYFISKGLDALKDENSVMAYVVPSGFLNTASDKQKEILASKGKLIDAYRLPVGVFPTTEVGTDIIIMQSWEKERKDLQKHWDSQGHFLTIDEAIKAEQKGHVDLLSNGEWFRQHPEKILGEIKKRTNRFGKEEEYVAVHESLTIQDELNKIEDLLPDTNKTQITQQAETVSNEKEQKPVTLSIEELSLAKSVIPEQQFITTLSLSKGEEGDFFKQKIKDIANAVSKAPKLYETDGAEQHALLFRYFHPAGTESLVCEIGEDGEAFGFQCINGDYINAEWGYIDLNELKKNPEMQLDYHVPKGMSIERWLYKEHPDMYPDYAKFAEQSEKTPFDIAKETGNDVEAVANAMNEQTPSEKVHSETVGESVDDKSLREYDDPDGLFKTPKILSMQEFSKFYTGNNFDEKDYNIWANTDYRGIVNTASLSAEEKEYLKTSGKYVEPEPGIYTNAMLYATGKIYEKLDELEKQKENLSSESYEKCKSILEKAVPELYPMSKIQMDVLSPLAEEFTVTRTVTRKQWDYGAIKNVTSDENLNLKEDFLSWCTGYLQPDSENTRTYIQDFSVANVSREEIPENISFNDIAAYVDRIPVNTGISEDDTKEERNAKLTVAGAKKDARKETAYKLFNRYLQTGLSAEEKEQFCLFWNKIYNGTVQADYKKLPLFIDGMSTYKGREPFKLYKQQIEGINRLVSKGNGLLAYGVGVGKTAAGICASIAQMQSKRAKRPLIICPDQVYEKWVRDLRELFPNVTINELGNLSDPFLEANHYDEATHSLIIPENSVSVMIDSALQKITFTDEACNEYLAKDLGCVLGLSAELESGDDRDRANALQKIQNLVGKASRIKTVKVPGDNIARETEIQQSYVFFDRCNWDNICVDEAHKYKNLFVIPRAKKGDKKQANEFEGIGSAAQSRRALKMFGMTTIIQQQNENRNVFLLTATPFTNNPLEVYSMLSFMARKELLDRHIYDVRDFCTEFALTKNEYAVTPDGDIKPKNVMKAFKGQKKLHSLITEFIDSKSAEDAGIPKPEGERHAVFLELTDLQQAIINYNEAAIKNASGKDGAVLRAMTHMRTATLSPALLDSDDYPGLDIPPLEKVVECSPKLKYECDTVADVYKHKPECGQFIYMPQGVESFQYVKEYLIKQGVPEEAIEYVSGKHNNTNKKKQKVADRFNDKEDKLKVLIGSSNVAEGIDLNGNSICCYNTMLGWNPTESVQVEGRIWRQGNEQGKVHIYYPLMEDSIDALIYQKHDEKASRINSIFKENENDQDTIDVSEIDPETVKFELIKDPVKKVDMLIEQDTAEFKKELKILENRTETINDLVKAYGIIKNMITEQKSEHEKYSELVKQYRENLKNIPENDSTRWQHEGKLEAAVHTRDVAYKELQKGNARMNSIMTNFMRMDIKVPETEAAIKLEEIARKKQAVLEKIESIAKSKDKRIEEEQIKLLQKKLVAKPLEQQRKETVEYILKNTWYKTTEEKVEPEKPVVKDASITTEPITSIPIELEERFNEALEKKDFKVLSQFCCWGDRNSIKEYSENNAAIKIFCDQFEKKYNIGLPSDIGDRFITLVNFCDPETLPEEYKFKDLEEAISYELKDLNSGTENSSKRIKEFYEKKPNVNEFANFLKEEYGTGGHSFIGYDHWHDAKGIKLTALINGKKESKLYSWNEIASRMSKIIEKSRPRVDFEIMSEEKRKSFDSFQQQDLFGFEELNPSKVLEYGEYDEIGFTSKFINANKGLLPVIKEKEDVYKVYCKGKDICNYESSKDIYIHDADDVKISVSKKLLQNVARQYIQNKVIENIKSEYEDGNFKKKKIAVPKLSEITETQKDVFIKNGIDDENEMLKMYRETYKDVLLSGEKPILVAKKQDSSVSVKDSRTVTKEATYIINDENIGY